MSEFFDSVETRAPEIRELGLLGDLRDLLAWARPAAPHLDRQLAGIDLASLTDRAALAQIPVLRKGDLLGMQAVAPPFAGLTTTPPGQLKRLLMSPGPIFDPEGYAADWWGAGRALFAAGFRKGDIVLNTFSYHFTPGAHIMESGAHAVGCAVIPAGPGQTEMQIEAIAALKPNAYCGTPDFLKILLEKAEEAGKPALSLRKALVSGAAFPPSLQQAIAAKGVEAYQAYATADLGIIAYETPARAGLVINEGILVEIVRPGSNDPVADGEVGEIVVTRLNRDYPLLRFGTGDLSKILDGASPCGRTNRRLAGWMGRADQRTKVKGMFVDPAQVDAVARKHPGLGRMRLVVRRENEQDTMVLRVETAQFGEDLAGTIGEALRAATNLKGDVELVPLGSLPNDGKVIADERPVG
ncbi:MAG: AMP-binding protein [Beijerinckiaceae bacterium]|nr:AMP-binding protein [Beijerinckiaceae bacterium]MCZ8300936.1 AMP-binding protein [Beijerinckiaceae bacterium]